VGLGWGGGGVGGEIHIAMIISNKAIIKGFIKGARDIRLRVFYVNQTYMDR
jgi:hypothetical protein